MLATKILIIKRIHFIVKRWWVEVIFKPTDIFKLLRNRVLQIIWYSWEIVSVKLSKWYWVSSICGMEQVVSTQSHSTCLVKILVWMLLIDNHKQNVSKLYSNNRKMLWKHGLLLENKLMVNKFVWVTYYQF